MLKMMVTSRTMYYNPGDKMANRELLMLADTYDRKKARTAGMYLSEKLDGMRAVWIPATRGLKVAAIPFANRDKDTRDHEASGLWSRYGKPIFAPGFFLHGFPPYPLDGELYAGRGQFQTLMSAVKKHEFIESEWLKVKYHVFDAPLYKVLLGSGRINNPQMKKTMRVEDNLLAIGVEAEGHEQPMFDHSYRILNRDMPRTNFLTLHPQVLLPFLTTRACEIVDEQLEKVTGEGGEGLMLRHPASLWEPVRSKFLLKVKSLHDAEALVVGYRAGQGKYLGMLGSLTVRWEHGTFELSGFTDEERTLQAAWGGWAAANPGDVFPGAASDHRDHISTVFPLNSVVTFRYRELTDGKHPKEARYLRPFAS